MMLSKHPLCKCGIQPTEFFGTPRLEVTQHSPSEFLNSSPRITEGVSSHPHSIHLESKELVAPSREEIAQLDRNSLICRRSSSTFFTQACSIGSGSRASWDGYRRALQDLLACSVLCDRANLVPVRLRKQVCSFGFVLNKLALLRSAAYEFCVSEVSPMKIGISEVEQG